MSSIKKPTGGSAEIPGVGGSEIPRTNSTMSPSDTERLAFLLNYSMKDSSFRKGIARDPAGTIEIYRSKLGFGAAELSEVVLNMIGSFSEEELKFLAEISYKLTTTTGGEEAIAAEDGSGGNVGRIIF